MKKIKIIKLVNHELTSEQLDDLKCFEVVELPESWREILSQTPDNAGDINKVVSALVTKINSHGAEFVLSPVGSPAFAAALSIALEKEGIVQIFSHSVREFKEIRNADGSIAKTNVFRHIKYINMPVDWKMAELLGFNEQDQRPWESIMEWKIRTGQDLSGIVPKTSAMKGDGRLNKDDDDIVQPFQMMENLSSGNLPDEVKEFKEKLMKGENMGEDDA